MIRLLIIFTLLPLFLFSNTSIDANIKKTNTKLSSFSKNYSIINNKMAKTAKAILKQKREILRQQRDLDALKKELKEKESSYKVNTKELKTMKKAQTNLKTSQGKLEEKLLFTIAQSVSLSVILEEEVSASKESLIEFEVLKVMLKNSKKKVKLLNKKFYTNSKNIDTLNIHASSLEVAIASIDTKRKRLLSIQKKNKKSLKKLRISKSSYKKELKKLLNKQDLLKKTLAKLNIIKVDEIKKAREEKDRKKAFESKRILSNNNLPTVKKHGSSYQKIKTKKYYGNKTIAPFSPYKITKRYGTYTDPIYGIKVFNESISLKPSKKNTKVKTVFNGKVIYADKTSVLNNIVIIEHKNGLHTIYANLSQISPNIKKGKKIKKGYTIGRVSEELIFEVTQKSFHINPIRLFK
ncbi:M23 family metallopeptidase [Sulfurimonas sp.]|uniref:murein hydrolase activator EnvC family protein n=1 Tax=Sulfurimonas sp. TaxID=2022749 RepID=UPI002AB2F1A9|nr:M23 family metallopeptidase [Sulfurimonas sp.]